MKSSNIIKSIFAAVAMLTAAGAWADTWTDPDTGYIWTYRINGNAAEIYNDGSCAISPAPTGSLTVPASLGGKLVTSIGNFAFENCRRLTGVTIPNSVTSIGSAAFKGCSGLTSVTVPNSVTSIGDFAFSGCSGLADANGFVIVRNVLYRYIGDESMVTIPDSVTEIADFAFLGCGMLKTVKIGNGLVRIGRYAFLVDCDGEWYFYNADGTVNGIIACEYPVCSCIESFIVAEGNPCYSSTNGLLLTKDGDKVIRGINGMVVIPDGVTCIGDYAFQNCTGLTVLTIPDSVEYGMNVVSACL